MDESTRNPQALTGYHVGYPPIAADDEEVQGLLPRSGDIAVVAADALGIAMLKDLR